MTSYRQCKRNVALALVAFFLGAVAMRRVGVNDVFPMFTWNLYSLASLGTAKIAELEVTSIDGNGAVPADLLANPRGSKSMAFSRTLKFASAVRKGRSDRAREILRTILAESNVSYTSSVDLNVHILEIEPARYLGRGEVVARSVIPVRFDNL